MILFRYSELYIAHLQQLQKQSADLILQFRQTEQKDMERYATGQLKGVQLALEALEIVVKSTEYLSQKLDEAQQDSRQ